MDNNCHHEQTTIKAYRRCRQPDKSTPPPTKVARQDTPASESARTAQTSSHTTVSTQASGSTGGAPSENLTTEEHRRHREYGPYTGPPDDMEAYGRYLEAKPASGDYEEMMQQSAEETRRYWQGLTTYCQ